MLRAVMYHYVRDLPRTRFSRIKGMLTADFARQVARLAEQFEMASLAAALAYLNGEYQPRRDLCLLTFDDGLKEHFTDVTPILAERRIQGLFFLITSCVDEHRVAHVHKNHFLMAWLDFGAYRDGFLEHLRRADPGFDTTVDPALAAKTYRWDEPDVAAFKYLLNFRLPEPLKAKILDAVFAAHLGDEAEFSRKLYVGWEEARAMQAAGMLVGGHSHAHSALATLSASEQSADLQMCRDRLIANVSAQQLWPFSYPYGKRNSFTPHTIDCLRGLGFACAFATEVGDNLPGQEIFEIRRIDPKDINT